MPSALLTAIHATTNDTAGFLLSRFPRLTAVMKRAAILSTSETACGLRIYIYAHDGLIADDNLDFGVASPTRTCGSSRAAKIW